MISTLNNGWEEIYTPEGVPYYVHKESNKITWDKPKELRTKQDHDEDEQNWVFVNDPEDGFVAVNISSQTDTEIHGTSYNGQGALPNI